MRLVVSADEIDAALDFPALIDALARGVSRRLHRAARHHHAIEREGAATATHLLMPAWTTSQTDDDAFLGTKIVNVFPDNGRARPSGRARPLSAAIGRDRRAAGGDGRHAAHALAHRRRLGARRPLSRARRRVAACSSSAPARWRHSWRARTPAVRPIEEVAIWNHRPSEPPRSPRALDGRAPRASRSPQDLENAVRDADVISCATLSTDAAHRRRLAAARASISISSARSIFEMREADDEALRRARVFIDTDAALSEGGDVALALRDTAPSPRGHSRRRSRRACAARRGAVAAEEITLFKSVGAAIEDLAAAMLVWRKLRA